MFSLGQANSNKQKTTILEAIGRQSGPGGLFEKLNKNQVSMVVIKSNKKIISHHIKKNLPLVSDSVKFSVPAVKRRNAQVGAVRPRDVFHTSGVQIAFGTI